MYMYVHICTYMYIYVHICKYVCVYIYTYKRMCVCAVEGCGEICYLPLSYGRLSDSGRRPCYAPLYKVYGRRTPHPVIVVYIGIE